MLAALMVQSCAPGGSALHPSFGWYALSSGVFAALRLATLSLLRLPWAFYCGMIIWLGHVLQLMAAGTPARSVLECDEWLGPTYIRSCTSRLVGSVSLASHTLRGVCFLVVGRVLSGRREDGGSRGALRSQYASHMRCACVGLPWLALPSCVVHGLAPRLVVPTIAWVSLPTPTAISDNWVIFEILQTPLRRTPFGLPREKRTSVRSQSSTSIAIEHVACGSSKFGQTWPECGPEPTTFGPLPEC